jgi:hypothetical protein
LTSPTPLRALLWWPPIAFALAVLQPSAAATVIAADSGQANLPVGGHRISSSADS